MPSFFILEWRVVRFIASLAAAPAGPLRVHFESRRTCRMCSRSASSRVLPTELCEGVAGGFNSDNGSIRLDLTERITARSMKFSSSRTLS